MIFKASIQHAQLLSELGAETFYNAHKGSATEAEIAIYNREKYNINIIRKELANHENIYHLISNKNNIAGFSKIELNMKYPAVEITDVSKMDQIYLLESFQGIKLGAELMSFNIEYSKSSGQNGMWLIVWIGNITAIRFYEKFGFHVVTKADFRVTDSHFNTCYIMLLKYENK